MPVPADPATHRTVRIRPLERADDGQLRKVFAGLSPQSRYLRYQRAAPVLSSSMARALVDIRPGFHIAPTAELDGEPVGIARWIRQPTDPTHAEIAVEVIDAVQGRGLGRRLTAAAAGSALEAGIEWLTLWVHSQHEGLRERLLSLGARPAADDPDEFRIASTALLAGSTA